METSIFYGLILCIRLIYWYLTRNFNYWSKRGIDGPKPKPMFGNFIDKFFIPKPHLEETWFRKFGKIYGVYNANKPALVVAEPELIKAILVEDFHIFPNRVFASTTDPILSKSLFSVRGDNWKRIRSIVSPTFSSSKMKRMFPLMKQCLTHFLDTLEFKAKDGGETNMKDLFGHFSMDVIATCAFATKINSYQDPKHPFIKNAVNVTNLKAWRLFLLFILPRSTWKIFNMTSTSDPKSNEFLINLGRSIIRGRQNSHNQNHNDFIQLLLNAEKNGNNNNGKEKFKFITEEEILAQIWTFTLGGYETTANTLTFATYELALNQDIQKRLYEEVMTAVDANGDIDYDILSRLIFLDSVVSETLRRYAPLLYHERKAIKDYKLGATGITIQKGQHLYIPIHAIHNSEEFFEHPNRFDPDRFMPENRHKIIPYTYLPFGTGPRNCVGMRFALMEVKLCLAQMVRRFRLKRVVDTEVPLVLNKHPFVYSPRRVIFGIEMRNCF